MAAILEVASRYSIRGSPILLRSRKHHPDKWYLLLHIQQTPRSGNLFSLVLKEKSNTDMDGENFVERLKATESVVGDLKSPVSATTHDAKVASTAEKTLANLLLFQ